jgi:hypothetical protein
MVVSRIVAQLRQGSVLYFLRNRHDEHHAFRPAKERTFGGRVRVRKTSFLLRWVSLIFITLALVLTAVQLVRYSIQRSNYPPQLTIGGVSVGGLDPQATPAWSASN